MDNELTGKQLLFIFSVIFGALALVKGPEAAAQGAGLYFGAIFIICLPFLFVLVTKLAAAKFTLWMLKPEKTAKVIINDPESR